MLYFPIIVSIFSLLFVFFLVKQIQTRTKLSQVIKQGAAAFLKRQYRIVAIVAIPLFFILWFIFGFKSGFAFLLGAVATATAGFVGMTVSLQSNLKVAEGAAKAGFKKSLEIFFKSGSVAGLSVVGSGLLTVSIFYLLTSDLKALIFLGLGGSLISVFARIGKGIFAKAVDVGLDPVSKTEEGILKNDAGNSTIIANQIGEDISGCFSMAADLFETYVVTLISAMILAGTLFSADSLLVFLPILLGATGILSSIIGSFFVSLGKKQNIMAAVYKGLAVSVLLAAVGFYPPIKKIASLSSFSVSGSNIYLASFVGLVILVAIFMITEHFTSKKHKPVKKIASASQNGQASNIIVGLEMAIQATILPGILISSGILASFWLTGIYGVALAAVAMVSLAGIMVSIYNLGDTAKSLTNSYGIISAGLASLVLFFNFSQELIISGSKLSFFLNDPKVIAGLFLGSLLCYFFISLVTTAVSLKQTLVLGLILVLFPIAVGFVLGPLVLAGALVGSILTGLFLGISMILGGTVWSNARKYIEEGNYGGKDSFAHQAAVIGEAVANPYKDTIGPSIGSLIKVVNIVALLIVSFLV
jgi:K(+)-stimulated pyrophosphate-energized sodium pump